MKLTIRVIRLIRALLGALRIVKRDLCFIDSNTEGFLSTLKNKIFIVITRSRTPNFIQGGIEGATNFPWHHAAFGYTAILENIRVIEAEANGIENNYFDKYLNDDTQMSVFCIELSDFDKIEVMKRAFNSVGHKYDYDGFIRFIIPDWPGILNGDDPKAEFCSALVVSIFKNILKLPPKPSPGKLYELLARNIKLREIKYNWK